MFAAIESERQRRAAHPEAEAQPGLLYDAWEPFSHPTTTRQDEDFQALPTPSPDGFDRLLRQVVRVERLREVQAMVGFTRMEAPSSGLRARRLVWPASARPSGAAMYAKILVVDRIIALVGSANLTGHALERNLEAGLLVRGGPVPPLIVDHLLTADGLERV